MTALREQRTVCDNEAVELGLPNSLGARRRVVISDEGMQGLQRPRRRGVEHGAGQSSCSNDQMAK